MSKERRRDPAHPGSRPAEAGLDLERELLHLAEDIEDRRVDREIRAQDIRDRRLRRKLVTIVILVALAVSSALAAYAIATGRLVFLSPIAPSLAAATALAVRHGARQNEHNADTRG